MNFVAIKTPEQSDLLSLHRVRSRLVRKRTAIINRRHSHGTRHHRAPRSRPLAQSSAPDLKLTSRGTAAGPYILAQGRHLSRRSESVSFLRVFCHAGEATGMPLHDPKRL